jgi:hypothetical protein
LNVNTHSILFPSLVATLVLAGGCFPGGMDDTAAADTEAGSDDGTGSDGGADDGDGDGGPVDGDTGTPDDADGSGGATDDGATDDGPAPAGCGGGDRCMNAIPEGWQGPVALISADAGQPLPACAGDFPNELPLDLGEGFDAGEAACMCECTPLDPVCEMQAQLAYWNTGLAFAFHCNNYPPDGLVNAVDGIALAPMAAAEGSWIPDPSGAWRVDAYEQEVTGSCQPSASSSIPEPSYLTNAVACGMDEAPQACDDGVCLPTASAPFDGRVCVWMQGAHECTDSTYSEQQIYYTGYDDDRSCPTCSCGELSGNCSDPHFTPGFYSGEPAIAWDDETVPIDGTCNGHVLASGVHNALSVTAGMPVGPSCGVTPGTDQVQGEAAPADAITFCCAG